MFLCVSAANFGNQADNMTIVLCYVYPEEWYCHAHRLSCPASHTLSPYFVSFLFAFLSYNVCASYIETAKFYRVNASCRMGNLLNEFVQYSLQCLHTRTSVHWSSFQISNIKGRKIWPTYVKKCVIFANGLFTSRRMISYELIRFVMRWQYRSEPASHLVFTYAYAVYSNV